MAMTLAILSFTCATLIAVFVPVKRVRTSVPHLALVLWLVAANLIHGVNAVLWAGNINSHIPVWCDIMTKFLLGANIAIPGAFLCIAMELERTSSSRTISTNPTVIQNRRVLEIILCYIIPLVYMASHLITQDHRFDIVRDLGCSASTHPSTLGFVIPWVPPVLICILVFVFSGVSAHHASADRLDSFTTHLKSRSSPMDSSLFFRRLATCMIITGALSIVSFSALFSVPNYKPWTSWAAVHADISVITIIQQPKIVDPSKPHGELSSIQIAWWGVFVVSVLYILLSFSIGEESRDASKWIRQLIVKTRSTPRQLVLPLHNDDLHKVPPPPSPEMSVSRSSSMNKPHLRPLTIELKSGWDEHLYEKPSKRGLLGSTRSRLSPTHCPSPTSSSSMRSLTPTSAYCKSPTEEDKLFMASTLSYLGSPTAKTLGISSSSPLQIPPPVFSPPSSKTFELPPKPSSPPPPTPTKPKSIMKVAQPRAGVPQDVAEPTMNSVFDAAWPIPPASPPPSSPPSRHGSPTRSLGHSPASSAEEIIQFGYALYPTVTPPHCRSGRPFEGSSVSSVIDAAIPSPSASTTPLPWSNAVRPAIRTLRRSWSKERIGMPHSGTSEVIRMTVVQETV